MDNPDVVCVCVSHYNGLSMDYTMDYQSAFTKAETCYIMEDPGRHERVTKDKDSTSMTFPGLSGPQRQTGLAFPGSGEGDRDVHLRGRNFGLGR